MAAFFTHIGMEKSWVKRADSRRKKRVILNRYIILRQRNGLTRRERERKKRERNILKGEAYNKEVFELYAVFAIQ
jgi:hypothetical protein